MAVSPVPWASTASSAATAASKRCRTSARWRWCPATCSWSRPPAAAATALPVADSAAAATAPPVPDSAVALRRAGRRLVTVAVAAPAFHRLAHQPRLVAELDAAVADAPVHLQRHALGQHQLAVLAL